MNLDKRLLGEARAVRYYLALTVGLGLLAGVITVAQALLLSGVVAQVFLAGKSLEDVRAPLLALLGVIVVRAVLTWAREVSAYQAAGRIKGWLRERLFAHLLALGPAYTRGERTGELTNALVEGVEALEAYFGQYLPNLALAALVPLTILIFVFPLDLVSGLVLLLTAPLLPLFMVLIGKLADALTKRQWASLSRMSAHFLDVLQGLTTLKLLGRSKAQAEVIGQISGRFRDATLGVLRVAFLSALALEILGTMSTAIVAVEVGLRLLYGTISFEQAFFVLIVAPEFYLPLRALGASFHAGMSGVVAARRIFEVLETPLGSSDQAIIPGDQRGSVGRGRSEEPRPRRAQRFLAALGMTEKGLGMTEEEPGMTEEEPGMAGRGLGMAGKEPGTTEKRPGMTRTRHSGLVVPASLGTIRFEGVHYAYEGGRRPALRGVSFEVAAGERVALVGPSGAGKSTVAYLLLRFVEPDRGEILIDGGPLRGIPAREWRRLVAWVPQHPYLFQGTVAENVRLGRPEAGMDEVAAAARLAHAEQFIRRLPQGFDTPIGERGARLSGGEAQRIALARAFLKDAPLLVFDEASANLDPAREALLQEATGRLMAGRTALIIAHRLSTVYQADRIVVLSGGQVVEAGTHRALLEGDGLYRRMVLAYGGVA